MPSAPIHLQVADLIEQNKNIPIADKKQFFLGAIAPDAVNLKGFAKKEQRYKVHFRLANLEHWKINVVSLYNRNLGSSGDDSFLLGYCVHLLTDIFWDEFVQPEMLAGLSEVYGEKIKDDEFLKKAKWQELYRYNNLVKNALWLSNAKELLAQAKTVDFEYISKEILSDYRDYLVNDYSDKQCNEPPIVVNEKMVSDTARHVANFLEQMKI